MAASEVTLTSEPVGKSVPRVDAYEKVTGSAVYADDMQFGPGLYYGRLVRSPHAHALVKRVDASKALAVPGVKAVVTGADTPKNIGLYLIIVFISYQGITLNFKGSAPAGVLSPILGLAVGLLNGYFVAGTVWHYMHAYRYPFGAFSIGSLSNTAEAMLRFLPPNIFEKQPGFLLALLLLLLILSVWK